MAYAPDSKRLPKADEEKILKQLRADHDRAENHWSEVRDEGDTDMRYVSGNPWPPADRAKREAAGRPCLSLDEMGQYINQVVNDVRASKRAVKFAPTGNGANDDTAEFYQNKMREIEYRSKATIVYTTAFQNAVERSFGACRVTTRHRPKSHDLDIWLEPFPNPNVILPDPNFRSPTGSDMTFCFVREKRTHAEFKREFPWARVQDFDADAMMEAPSWIDSEEVQLAEYWVVKKTKKKLYRIQPPPVQAPGTMFGLNQGPPQEPVDLYEDELEQMPDGGTVLAVRDEDVPSVCMYLTNGVEILKKVEWAGKYIPIAFCLGKVIYVNSGSGTKRQILSLTRLARDPYMLYCYYRTSEAELVGMTPKFPYFVRRGSLSPAELTNLQKSLHEPVAVIQVEPMVEGLIGTPPEFPQRNPFEPPIQALEIGAEAARRAIQAAMGGSPLPTSAQRRNEKSGKALQKIEESAQLGSFHFKDHYDDMIEHVGVMIEDLMDKIYDTARDVGVRGPQDEAQIVRINDPNAQPKDGKKVVKSVQGDHLVTVSSGPSFDSEREAASDFADTLAGMDPKIFALIGPLVVKLKNLGPIGDEIAEALTVLQPPELRKPKDGQEPDPVQLKTMLMQASQENQQLKQVLQEMSQTLQLKKIERQTEMERATLECASRERIAGAKDATTLDATTIKAETDKLIADLEAKIDLLKIQVDQRQAELDRAHQSAMGERGHQHSLEQQANEPKAADA